MFGQLLGYAGNVDLIRRVNSLLPASLICCKAITNIDYCRSRTDDSKYDEMATKPNDCNFIEASVEKI